MRGLTLFLLALVAGCEPMWAADTILPSSGKAVGVVRTETPGTWAVLSKDFQPVQVTQLEGDKDAGWRTCIFEGIPGGAYAVIKSEKGSLQIFPVTLGGVLPKPGPGPEPEPKPKPEPPPPPPLAGSRTVLYFHESADNNPETGIFLNLMRDGPVKQYIAEHKHWFYPVDVHQRDSDDKSIMDSWKPHLKDVTKPDGSLRLPVVVVMDTASRKILLVKSYEGAAVAPETVQELLQQHGG
jgi:hypothetical protein